MVINDVCEVVCWVTVGLEENLIFDLLILDSDCAVNSICKGCGTLERCLLTDYVWCTCIEKTLDLLLRKITAVSVVATELVVFVERVKSFLCAEAIVGFAFLYKLLGIRLVEIFSLTLDIWAVLTAQIRTLVVLEANCLDSVIDNICCAFNKTLLVCVF